jgi:hypothetical protein
VKHKTVAIITAVGVLAAAAVIASAAVRHSGGDGVDNGGPLVAGDVQGTWTYNPEVRPALAWSLPLQNRGKRTLVLDRIRVLGATPGLHLLGACVAWFGTHTRKTAPAYLLDANCDLRPKAANTAVGPGRGFVPELRLQFTGQRQGWGYRSLIVSYHVGRHRYERRFDVDYEYLFCRTRACVKAFERNEQEGLVAPP